MYFFFLIGAVVAGVMASVMGHGTSRTLGYATLGLSAVALVIPIVTVLAVSMGAYSLKELRR